MHLGGLPVLVPSSLHVHAGLLLVPHHQPWRDVTVAAFDKRSVISVCMIICHILDILWRS
jgi:hypothetical protein